MKSIEEQAASLLPLTEATYLILAALVEPRHGYGIMQDVAKISDERVRLGPGTLYGALTNLGKQKLIERLGETDHSDDRRKVYGLTTLGKRVLVLESERLTNLAKLAKQVTARIGGRV